MKPAFKAGGIVTAGNIAGIDEGVASVTLVSEDEVKELGLIPMAEWGWWC